MGEGSDWRGNPTNLSVAVGQSLLVQFELALRLHTNSKKTSQVTDLVLHL